MRICTPIKIRYAETDKMGIVYHGNYALYLEDARTDFLNQVGYPYSIMEEQGYLSPVVEMQVKYGKPFQYGDTIIIRTRVIENKASKTTYAYELFCDGQDMDNERPYATAQSSHCIVDNKTFMPVNIKRNMPELYEKYQAIVEPE